MTTREEKGTAGLTLLATLTCPNCGHADRLEMATNSCLYFHVCEGCGLMLSPLAGDCCVFCSYADVDCPPRQSGNACCESPD